MKNFHTKMGAFIWSGIEGHTLTKEEIQWIEQEEISVLILFKRNIHSLSQLYELCQRIKSFKHSPLIAIDREGGPVDRLKHLPDILPWSAPQDLVRVSSLKEIEKTSFYMGRELKALGIAINLAPCLEIASVANVLFQSRLLGSSPEQVSQNAIAFIKGLRRAGLASVGKHFPGHGGVKEDSHKELPVDQRSLSELEKQDLLIFQKTFSIPLDILMSAHVLYPLLDPIYPATLSPFILKNLLRKKMSFQNLVISDDLDMKALSSFFPLRKVVIQTFLAGVDCILKCQASDERFEMGDWIRKALAEKILCEKEFHSKLQKGQHFKNRFSRVKPFSFQKLQQILQDSEAISWSEELGERLKTEKKSCSLRDS